jgi:protein-tyrosine-phosphatase
LTLGLPVTVKSRGILRLENAGALPEAIELALWLGIDLSSHRTHQLELASLHDVDLVLGFEQAHVRHAVVDGGASRARTFGLNELIVLLTDSPSPAANGVKGWRHAVAEAQDKREIPAPQALDIGDPFGRSWKAQRRIADEIRDATIKLVSSLFGVTKTTGLPPLPAKLPRRRRTPRGASSTDT